MKVQPIVFISIMDYDNLGVGYLASMLSDKGFATKVLNIEINKPALLKIVRKTNPLLIGFSVVFHNHIEKFAETAVYLRSKGINCHITAGGHYATLQTDELFRRIPGLDSIIRFEGEYPVMELAHSLSLNKDWKTIGGIAYHEDGKIITNPPLPLEKDLDRFPFPARSFFRDYAFGRKFTVLLAGRGCIYNCTFCNTREFYRQAGGPVKRLRRPEAVVNEMNFLFKNKDVSVFIFQDDDFPVRVAGRKDWIVRFCKALKVNKLDDKVLWKINCRPDEIDEESILMMRDHGLFLVFLGIEDGTDSGLKRLNKKMSVKGTAEGIEILKRTGIDFDFGFMLFQPATTFITLRENIEFLRLICGDGYTPATFLKLIPFYETRVADELSREGRLMILSTGMDYDFIEEPMGNYYNFISECFSDWLENPRGVENLSKWARNYFSVFSRCYESTPEFLKLRDDFRNLISECNTFMLDTLRDLATIYEKVLSGSPGLQLHEIYKGRIMSQHTIFRLNIITIISDLKCLEKRPVRL